jgi:hypothetical protein
MNDHTTAVLFGILLATALDLVAGWAIGDLTRRYRQGVRELDSLRRQLPEPYSAVLFQQRQLREIRSVLNDAHRLIHAVSKGLEKRPS